MVRVAVCDDDVVMCEMMEGMVCEYRAECGVEILVDIYYSGEELVKGLCKEQYDLIFLDIELGGNNGVEIGREIRNEMSNYVSKIVFVSSSAIYSKELLSLQPFNFLDKPVSKSLVFECMNLLLKILEIETKCFEYKSKHNVIKVPFNEIIYFEAVLKKIKIVTLNGEDFFYDKLENIKSKMPKNFISPHRSYLVNYSNIKTITSNSITFNTIETNIPISRTKLKEIREKQLSLEKTL